jgi:hypothetical protein
MSTETKGQIVRSIDWKKRQMGQNIEWIKRRMGQNIKWKTLKIKNKDIVESDKMLNGEHMWKIKNIDIDIFLLLVSTYSKKI